MTKKENLIKLYIWFVYFLILKYLKINDSITNINN